MAVESFPLKSLALKSVNYDISPCYVTSDFSEGTWNMCISDIICSGVKMANTTLPKHIAVTCNFVTAEKCLFNGRDTHTYQQPLAMFMLERGHTSLSFDKTWFRVNAPSDCHRLKFIDTQIEPLYDDEIRLDGKVTVLVLFQRVK